MQTVCPRSGNSAYPVMLSLEMLAAFVKVAETRSVSAAATGLGVGKSVVSKRIAQLEAGVGATLFARSTRRVALTPAGEAYLEFARRAIGELRSGEERLRDLRAELTGKIRVTAPVSWGQRVLARRLPEFLRLHPAIELELTLADRVMDIAFERIDVALRWTTLPQTEHVAVPVATVDWLLAASPAYLATAGTPREPLDLTAHPCMCYWREHSDDAWVLGARGQRQQVHVKGRYHADHPEAVADAALASLGIAMLPGYLCEAALADGRLVRVLPAWTPITKFGERIHAVVSPERGRIARNRALIEFLRQQLGGAGVLDLPTTASPR